VDPTNAFIGRIVQPTPAEIERVLEKSAPAWKQFIEWMVKCESVGEEEWKSSSAKYGWSLLMKKKKRTVVYLAPAVDCFRVSFVLGPRAVEAARESDLPPDTKKAIEDAPRYSEGTGVRFVVRYLKDLEPLRTLVQIKLAN